MNEQHIHTKCLLIDDEPHAMEVIEHHLQSFPNYQVLAQFTNAIDARFFLKQNPVDLLFLDIQMPGLSGLEFLKSLQNPPTVFLTTAYRHYAPEAFELEVLDYLLKPISLDRLRKALQKYEQAVKLNDLLPDGKDETILIRSNRVDHRIPLHDIIYVEAKGDYLKIHLKTRSLLSKGTLKELGNKLPPTRFKQIQRSYIINLAEIQSESAHSVSMGSIELPVGRSFRS